MIKGNTKLFINTPEGHREIRLTVHEGNYTYFCSLPAYGDNGAWWVKGFQGYVQVPPHGRSLQYAIKWGAMEIWG